VQLAECLGIPPLNHGFGVVRSRHWPLHCSHAAVAISIQLTLQRGAATVESAAYSVIVTWCFLRFAIRSRSLGRSRWIAKAAASAMVHLASSILCEADSPVVVLDRCGNGSSSCDVTLYGVGLAAATTLGDA